MDVQKCKTENLAHGGETCIWDELFLVDSFAEELNPILPLDSTAIS